VKEGPFGSISPPRNRDEADFHERIRVENI
jgi:hypothetical protein